jgi:rubrerythrin
MMDLTNSTTANNLSEAFGGESMANRKYLFFAEVAKQLGLTDLAKLFSGNCRPGNRARLCPLSPDAS